MTEREIIERGEQARAILDGPLFTEVIIKHRQSLLEQIAVSQPDQRELRETCYYEIRALDGLRQDLRRIRDRGDKKRDKVTN